MANWIKMRTNLSTDPRVVNVAAATNKHACAIVGALHFLWSLADEHTSDGKLIGYKPEAIDRMVGVRGLCAALRDQHVNWLEVGEGFLQIPRFDTHNGDSAKRRANNAVRAAMARDPVQRQAGADGRARNAHGTRTESAPRGEEIRGEEKKDLKPPSATAKPAAVVLATKPATKAPAKPKAEPTDAQSDARWWTDRFCQAWSKSRGGAKYPFKGGRDGKAMSDIRECLDGTRGMWDEILERYFADRDPFTIKQGHTLHYLANRLATFMAGVSAEEEVPWRDTSDLDPKTRSEIEAIDRQRAQEYARMTPEQLAAEGVTFTPHAKKPQESAA